VNDLAFLTIVTQHPLKLLYFSDHDAHLKSVKKIESVPYNAVCLLYESGHAFSSRTNCMW